MADDRITIRFDGTAEGLLAAAKQVSGALHQIQGETKTVTKSTVAAGAAMGAAYADLARKALSFAKNAFGAFSSVASEVRKMQAILGGTAEDMSRLRFASEVVGVSFDTVTRSMSILAPKILSNSEKFTRLGIAARDADGNMRPSIDLLGEISDKLNSLGPGLERTAAARELFGRGFAEINPLLRLGSERIKEFAEESDKMGLTLTQKDLVAARQFKLAMHGVHAGIQGLTVELGRAFTPILITAANAMKSIVSKFRDLMNSSSPVAGIIKGITAALVVLISVLAGVALATKAWAVAQSILNSTLLASPTTWVIVGIVALVAAIIALVKNFDLAGRILTKVFEFIGSGLGKLVSIWVTSWRHMGDIALNTAGFITNVGAKLLGWVPGLGDKIKKANEAVKSFHKTFDSSLTKVADTAWNKGGQIGKKLGESITNGIKNLKMPTLKIPEQPTPDPSGGFDFGGDGTKTKKKKKSDKGKKAAQEAAEKARQALKDYWSGQVDIARNILKDARDAAIQAKKDMDALTKQVADSMVSGFNIVSLVDQSFAKYLGPTVLVDAFKKKLARMKDFVTNLKTLKGLGLPVEMLVDLANAGVDGGYDAAKLLVANPSVIGELQTIQAEISGQAQEAGALVSGSVMGAKVAETTKTAEEAQKSFAGTVGEAVSKGEYVPTAEDKALLTTPVTQEITIQVDAPSQADPQAVADAVAWSVATGATAAAFMALGSPATAAAAGFYGAPAKKTTKKKGKK